MSKGWTNLLEEDDEDAIFARIQEESLRHYREIELPRRVLNVDSAETSHIDNDGGETSHIDNDGGETSHIDNDGGETSSNRNNNKENVSCLQSDNVLLSGNDVFYRGSEPGAEGFHLAAGQTYIYPTNYPLREYQVNIVRSALFHNTLVCLPTGLGKTFIAAVVMYNYYRWFPRGKIVFMAPTRPLVAQQIRACHDITGIPQEDTIEMTGTLNPIERIAYWKSRRVFFLTPQVLANDLRSKACPASFFKCVVVDEAHRATKEYAYCQVVRALEDAGATFRMLALSATPGSNVKGVVEVVQNLRIAKLEMRGEESLDVSKYIYTKNIQTVVVELKQETLDIREQFLNIYDKYAKSLIEARIITSNINNITKFQLLKAGEKIKSHAPNGMSKATSGYLMSDLGVCMSLAHALDLLQIYGLRAFQHYLTAGSEEGEKSTAAFTRLKKDGDLYGLLDKVQKMLSGTETKIWSHPKLESLVDIVKKHFSTEEKNTKAIIFCQYRVVVSEVFDILERLDPTIRPIMFVGQSSSREKCGLPQKKQLEVMKGFRDGEYNILIATCVAEEGLDIGAVDLLILMEAHRSPVRLVQRLGRTGRHRKGQCFVLLTKGKEVQKFKEAMETRKSYLTTIMNSPVILANMYDNEPSMLPTGVLPKQQLLHIRVAQRQTPGKPKKQSDIRNAFSAKATSIQPPISPFLSPDEINQVAEELGTTNVNFSRMHLPNSHYLWNRTKENPMNSGELFATSYSYLSEWNDWNRTLQQTFEVGHSSDSEMLCHLLHKADLVQVQEEPIIGLNSQICVNQLLRKKDIPIKKKKKEDKVIKNVSESNKKYLKNPKMDIRNCLALAGEKTKLTQQKLLDEFNLLSQKVKLDESMTIELTTINDDEAVKSPNLHNEELNCSTPESICKEIVECEPSNSSCVFFANSELNRLITNVVMPKPVVKPTSSILNANNSFNLDSLKSKLTLDFIEQFNITKSFKQSSNCENSFIKHKSIARVLRDVKNIYIDSQGKTKFSQSNMVVENIKNKTRKLILEKVGNGKDKLLTHNKILQKSLSENDTNKKSENINLIDISYTIFESDGISSDSKALFEDPKAVAENENRFCYKIRSKQEEDLPIHLLNDRKCSQTSEVVLNEDVLNLSDIGIKNLNTSKNFENISLVKSTLDLENGNESKPASQSEQSISSDIVGLDDLFTEEVQNEMENMLFKTTPQSSRQILDGKQNSLVKKEKLNDQINHSSNIINKKEYSSAQYSNMNNGKQHCVEPDLVGIDDLFGEDDDLFSEEGDFSRSRKSHTDVINSTPTRTINKTVPYHNRSSLIKDSPVINRCMNSLTTSESLSQDKKILQFKIPEEKINLNSIKINSCASSDNDSEVELSPILSGRPSQVNNTFCLSSKLRRENLFPDKKCFKQKLKEHSGHLNQNHSGNGQNANITSELIFDDKMKNVNNDSDISVSQLFEDSDDEKNCDEGNYTMYTISQLVKKSSDFHVNKIEKDFQTSNEKNKFKELHNISQSNIFTDDVSVDDIFEDDNTEFEVKNKMLNYENTSKISPSILKNVLKRNSDVIQIKPNDKPTVELNSVQKTISDACKLEHYSLNSESNSFKNSTKEKSVIGNQSDFFPKMLGKNHKSNCKSSPSSKTTFTKKIFVSSEQYKREPVLSSGWMSARRNSTPLKGSTTSSSVQWLDCTDSDTNSDLFENLVGDQKKEKQKKNIKFKERKKTKKLIKEDTNGFVVKEADVSGPQISSDEENTSGLDDLDDSFIDDCTQRPNTSVNQTALDIQSVYLQTARSPMRRPGCFKIPNVRRSILEMDVFSQTVIEDQDSYVNDSFCVDETEIIENDPSILEIAEQILESKQTKRKKRKRKYSSSDSSFEEINPAKVTAINESLPVRRKNKVLRIVSDSETDMGSDIDL